MLVRPPTDLSAPLVHVGRQGIYDQTGDVVAYELSFRDAADAPRATSRGPYATSRVIISAFTDFGLEQLVGSKACFINVTREFLVGELPVPFDSGSSRCGGGGIIGVASETWPRPDTSPSARGSNQSTRLRARPAARSRSQSQKPS